MEKIEWLIDKLKRQYDAAAGTAAMLSTLQLLQQELTAQTAAQPSAIGKIAVIMPAPLWNTNADSLLDAYEAEHKRGEDEEKLVFELDPYVEEEPEQAPETITEPVVAAVPDPLLRQEPPSETVWPDTKHIRVEMPQPAHAAYLPETPPQKTAPEPVREPEIIPLAAGEIPPSVAAVEMPKPVPDTNKRSLNELLEKPAAEMVVRFQEPIRDLKKAISINDRYQYINNLFSGDEAIFDRSIKTINSFNVFSEAEYWIRRELATRYGWEENDSLVQQFYELVSRRFS